MPSQDRPRPHAEPRVADHLQPPLPVLAPDATLADVAALTALAARVGPALVSRAEACHAAAAGLGRLPAAVLARPVGVPVAPGARLHAALARLARWGLPAAPVAEAGRDIGSVQLTEVERLRVAPHAALPLDWLAALPAWARDRVPPLVRLVAERGERVYLVGGAVRDLLLGLPIDDVDLMVAGDVAGLAATAAARFGAGLVQYPEFGTATLTWPDGGEVDLATARHERYPAPAALPVVTAGTALTDLHRRDFTINAMAVRLDHANGFLIDPYWGSLDLGTWPGGTRAGRPRLRTLHGLSFVDDPTRLFRAARFAARLPARLDPFTRRTLDLGLPFVAALSGERVRHELELVWREARPELALRRLDRWGVLAALAAGLRADRWLADRYVAARAAWAEPPWQQPPEPAEPGRVYLALLLWRLPPAVAARLVQRLAAPREAVRLVPQLDRLRAALRELARPGRRPHAIADRLHGLSTDALLAGALVARSGRARRAIVDYQARWRYQPRLLNGYDVQVTLGVTPGPLIREALAAVYAATLDGEVTTPAEARAWLVAWGERRRAEFRPSE